MSVVVLQAPVMVARALSRRALHWIEMRHQQHKLKLSLRRRRRRSLLWRNRQELLIQKVLQHRSCSRLPGQQRRLLPPTRSPSQMGKKHKQKTPLWLRPPVRVPSQRALAKSRHITYKKMPPTPTAVQEARPEEGTTDEGIYEEIPVPLYRNLHTDLGHIHHPSATRSLRAPERPRIPQVPPKSRARSATATPTHSFSDPLSSSSSRSCGGQSLTLSDAFINEDRWMTFPWSSRPAIYQNLTFSASEVDSVENKSRCRGGNHISIEEWLEWWLEEERKVYSSGKKRIKNLGYSDVVERPATSSFETAGSDKASDSDGDTNDSSGPRNSELRLTTSKSSNRISKLIQQFENTENDCELDVRLKTCEIIQGESATFAHKGPKDNSTKSGRPLPPRPSTLPSSLQPSRSWSAFESDRLDGLVSSRLSLPVGHFDGPVQAINPMYISQASEAVTEFRMLSSSRSSVPRGCDSISSLSSISASSLVDSLVPSTAMAPSANIANRCPWMAQESIHGSAFPKSSSVQLPKNTSAPLRPGYNPSLQGADKGYTRHIPPKGTSPAPAKSSYALAPPRPPALQKPSLPSLNSSASDPTTKATGLENFRIKCTVSLGEGETVILEQVHIDLMNEPWFHMITRKKAEKYVMNSKDGTFLIRPSTRNIDPLTLCLRYQGRTYNIPIRQRTSDKCFALGMEKANELAFKTVPLLVEAYHEKPIKLQTGNRTLLKDTPPKLMENVYVKHSTSSA